MDAGDLAAGRTRFFLREDGRVHVTVGTCDTPMTCSNTGQRGQEDFGLGSCWGLVSHGSVAQVCPSSLAHNSPKQGDSTAGMVVAYTGRAQWARLVAERQTTLQRPPSPPVNESAHAETSRSAPNTHPAPQPGSTPGPHVFPEPGTDRGHWEGSNMGRKGSSQREIRTDSPPGAWGST